MYCQLEVEIKKQAETAGHCHIMSCLVLSRQSTASRSKFVVDRTHCHKYSLPIAPVLVAAWEQTDG